MLNDREVFKIRIQWYCDINGDIKSNTTTYFDEESKTAWDAFKNVHDVMNKRRDQEKGWHRFVVESIEIIGML